MGRIGDCGWKTREGRCGAPAYSVRDLGPRYGATRLQPVCKRHALIVDSTARHDRAVTDPSPPGETI